MCSNTIPPIVMAQQKQDAVLDLSDLWTQHQRRRTKTTQSWACIFCVDRKIFSHSDELWNHAKDAHHERLPVDDEDMPTFRTQYETESAQHRDTSDEYLHKISRKRPAFGDGISDGSASPFRDYESPPPRRSKAGPTSTPYGDTVHNTSQRPNVGKKMLWTPDQDTPLTRASCDPSQTASNQARRSRTHLFRPKTRQSPAPPPQEAANPQRQPQPSHAPQPIPLAILGRAAPLAQALPKDEAYDIVLQPETRPISQEQLVAEVKGIYAGLAMVEAKCIEVDNKHATLASTDLAAQPKLNNEQWQALIALHRTLLHEHHDFFLASQHPSASPALRRLASKYAMPARMWRHGVHSFLELLRHRLPASLDHMLAFIYLAYSMMALLYETVPAFEDTWIECLGDLGRYRMAIEDDDIRDREVWTGVAQHWYSKASDKAPTTGRLYHHLAILARPNALQQLFYYSKSLCVAAPFTSAREPILMLSEPLLSPSDIKGQYRLPPLDRAFVQAHGLLLTSKDLERFDVATEEFLDLLDNQLGRVTRKFMEQGYHIVIANYVAILEFASEDDDTLMDCFGPDASSPETTLEKKTKVKLRRSVSRASAEDLAHSDAERSDETVDPETTTLPVLDSTVMRPWIPSSFNGDPSKSQTTPGIHTAGHNYRSQRRVEAVLSSPNANPAATSTTCNSGHLIVFDIGYRFFVALKILLPFLNILLLFEKFTTVASCPIQDPSSQFDLYSKPDTNNQIVPRAASLEPFWWILLQYCGLSASFLAILRQDTKESQVLSQVEAEEVRSGVQNETGSLLMYTSASAVGTFALGFNSGLSNFGLAPFWIFSGGLNFEYIRRKLAPLEKTAGATGLTIGLLDVVLVETVVRLSPPMQGRYADPVAFRICLAPPVAIFLEWCYVAYILNLGVAERFEIAVSRYMDGESVLKILQDERSRSREVRSNSRSRQGRRGRHS